MENQQLILVGCLTILFLTRLSHFYELNKVYCLDLKVLKNLNKYLTKEDKWTSKVALKEFLQFLCEEYGCESAYELGVRIQSIGLGISVRKTLFILRICNFKTYFENVP